MITRKDIEKLEENISLLEEERKNLSLHNEYYNGVKVTYLDNWNVLTRRISLAKEKLINTKKSCVNRKYIHDGFNIYVVCSFYFDMDDWNIWMEDGKQDNSLIKKLIASTNKIRKNNG